MSACAQLRAAIASGDRNAAYSYTPGERHITDYGAEQQASIGQAFSSAFMDGFHIALVIGGLVLLVGAFVAHRFIPGRETIEQHHADAEALAVAH
jgi:hypothetical protein